MQIAMPKHLPALTILTLLFVVLTRPTAAQELSRQSYLRADNLGITFVAHVDNLNRDADLRYQQALQLGAGWTRYPIYWNEVERSPGAYNWAQYDALVSADRAAGMQTNAILMGNPGFHGGQGSITGINAPVFADGTDTPGAGKQVNPNNPWARYVYMTVDRYRPGGLLARQRGWGATEGITVWEAWNEPDFNWFWRRGKAEYARLLKVTYLAAKAADPNAQVMFGGLAYGNPDTDDWLSDVLDIYQRDPTAPANNWYMDIVAVHSYTDARRTGLVVSRVKETLAAYGIDRPVWLNETGVAVWDDYPGPTWAAAEPASRRLRATQTEAAAYVVQTSSYAFAAGADKVFWHQLYDDCGNEPGNHAPGERSAGDAYGFYRNPRGYACYSQHPQPGTPRLSAVAYQTVARVFGRGELTNGRVTRRGDGSVFILFDRPETGERVIAMWNERPQNVTVEWTAVSTEAQVFSYTGGTSLITPVDGQYTATLAPARLNDDPQRPPGNAITIGGAAVIVVEQGRGTSLASAVVTPQAALPSEIGSVLDDDVVSQAATLNTLTGDDITPPTTFIDPLPEASPGAFTVRWGGGDAGGIEKFLVWVQINEGEWQPWLETTRTEGTYVGVPGDVVAFAVWAVDRSGNWSLNTDLEPQAWTVVQ